MKIFFVQVVIGLIVGILLTTAEGNTLRSPNPALNGGKLGVSISSTVERRPYQVAIQKKTKSGWIHFCAGSIVGQKRILTNVYCTEQCKYDEENCRVVAGAFDLSKIETTQQILSIYKLMKHPNFNTRTVDYDYGLIFPNENISFNEYVSTIEIAQSGQTPQGPCISKGWATTGVPEDIKIKNPSNLQCKTYRNFATERMICGGTEGQENQQCFVQDGDPLVCGSILVGIASWARSPCTRDKPGVFSDVAAGANWIKDPRFP